LIGTRRTIDSGVYEIKFKEKSADVDLASVSTPLLVPMIEEGFLHDRISHDIISAYLSDPALQGIEALILGCTHYPLIRKELEEYYNGTVDILDSSQITAGHVMNLLHANDALCSACNRRDEFLVSDFTPSFEASTRLFFGEKVRLTNYRLWE
jgi:glutamate racemase